MAKVRAPILSFGATGQIGKAAVFGSWRGIAYAREYIVPANPKTTAQELTRSVFSFVQAVWKQGSGSLQGSWSLYATGKPLTNRNAFAKFNVGVLRGEIDLANFVFSPGALGGLPPASMVVTPGVGTLTVDVTPPASLPTDWTINTIFVGCIKDQDPSTGTEYITQVGGDSTDPYSVVLTDLDAALYRVGAWIKWNRPDGSIAYSPSIHDSGTPT